MQGSSERAIGVDGDVERSSGRAEDYLGYVRELRGCDVAETV